MNVYLKRLRLLDGVLLMIASLTLAACGGGGSGEDGESATPGTTYDYNVTSTTYFTGGQQVAVVRIGISGSCYNVVGISNDIARVGAGTVTNPGSVSFSFTTEITPPMLESVYIDNNASGNLDSGDRVWGDNPNDFAGACFDSFNTNQIFDWETVAAQIQAGLGLSQPSIIYTGVTQSFRNQLGSEPGSVTNNTIIVNGDGYRRIRW